METKSAFKSVSIWGGLIAMLPAIGSTFGVVAPGEMELVVSGVGGLIAIIGRIIAKTKLKLF